MKLYYSPGACSLSPHIALCASGLPFATEKVDLSARPHRTANGVDLAAIHAKGYVPILQLDNGELLTEGAAIVQYIADQAPQKNLAPANGTLERYRLQEWLNYIASEVHKNFGIFFAGYDEKAQDHAWQRLGRALALPEQTLAQQDYLLGNAFTVADGYLFTCLGWTQYIQRSLSDFPALLAYRQRVAALPFVQQALKAEGLLD